MLLNAVAKLHDISQSWLNTTKNTISNQLKKMIKMFSLSSFALGITQITFHFRLNLFLFVLRVVCSKIICRVHKNSRKIILVCKTLFNFRTVNFSPTSPIGQVTLTESTNTTGNSPDELPPVNMRLRRLVNVS